MFVEREDIINKFRDIFVEVDGRSYFRMKGVDFLLPVTDEQIFDLTETFRFRHRLAMIAMWIVWGGAVVWWYVCIVSDEPGHKGWWILGGGFLAACLVHFAARTSTTWHLQTFMMNVHEGLISRPADALPVPKEETESPAQVEQRVNRLP